MLYKKILALSLLITTSLAFAVEMQPFFPDVTPNDSAYKAVVKYTQQGIFSGIDGRAELNDVISKEHAAYFLVKVLGDKEPNMDKVLEKGLLSSAPDPTHLLDHATWIKMLSNAFNVPIGNPVEGQPWYVAPFVIAQGIGAVKSEKPFDFASRRFVLETAEIYERVFGAKKASTLMDEQELRLMKIRDGLINPESTNNEIEELIWSNIVTAEEIPHNARIEAIKNLNLACLILLDLRKDPDITKKSNRQMRISFFLKRAVNALPDVEPFTQDLAKIGER